MGRPGYQSLRVYQLSEEISDQLWKLVIAWPSFAKETIGSQIVRAADSIGANIAEGYGRASVKDNMRFVRIARGSMNETGHFLRRAYCRNLLGTSEVEHLTPLLAELGPKLNAYLTSLKSSAARNRSSESP